MTAKVSNSGGEGAANAVLMSAAAGAPVVLPAGVSLAEAAFSRSGADLVVATPGHAPVVIRDFFKGETQPALVTADGAQISGDLVVRLAGPTAAGETSAAGTLSASDAIGRIDTVSGKAFVIRVDGTREELGVGSRLYTGDILETGGDSAVGVLLADETSLSMGADGRMVLDEMIYDPGTQEGAMSLSVLKGVYTIVSGMVSKTDPDAMVINTPVGSIGIRGTQVGLEIPDGQNLNIVMMREGDGYVGEVFIRNEAGLQVMNQAHQVVSIGGYDRMPTFAPSVDEAGVLRMFHSTLSHLPRASGRENDYSAPELRRAEGLESFTTEAGPTQPAAPSETIRVVEGDYTGTKTYESEAVPTPDAPAPAPAPEPESAPAPIETRTDDVVIPVGNLGIIPNEEPVALDLKATTSEDQAVAGKLTAADANADNLTFALAGDGGPKHGTVKVNADGTFAYTPNPDFSGIDTFTYMVSDGRGGTAVATATVEVTAVPDVPELTVTAAAGLEDSSIPIAISASVPGTEELASLIIAGVPKGARLSAGADNGDGTWTLAGVDLDALANLTLTPPADWSGDAELKVTATSTDGGVATAGFGVSVTPVPDLPVLSVAAASGAEDSAIPLAISASVPGNEEVVSLTISGVPEGAKLSVGTDNGDGTWTVKGADLDKLDTLALTPPADWSGEIALAVTAASTDGGLATAGFGVSVAPVADLPVLKVAAVSGSEDSSIPLSISASVPGNEEVASIKVSGVPEGATLSAGTDNGDGTWTLAGDDLAALDSLSLTPPADWSGSMALSVTAESSDGGFAMASFGVTVAPVPDVPALSVSPAAGTEDSAIPLSVSASVAGDESVASLTISGVPEGATLSAGTDNGDGTWTLAGDDLAALDSLTVTPPSNSSADFALAVTATSTDGGVATASFTVTVAPAADLPTLRVDDVTVVADDDGAGGRHGKGKHDADVVYGDSAVIGAMTVPLHVQAALADTDGSESLGITIAGVPDGVTLSAGTDLGDGSWSLLPGDLEGLQMTLPEGFRDDFELQVTATATDQDVDSDATDTAAATATITVAFAGEEGSPTDDHLKGGHGDDVLYGGAGNDRLEGGEGHDTLYGGSGNDRLEGGEGHDTLYGGSGNDRLEGGEGHDVLYGGAGNDRLEGGEGHDVLYGSSGNDRLEGGEGHDTLYGGSGNDRLEGGEGHDVLYGGTGNDTLEGGEGADVLHGGAGNDVLEGGEGADMFVFESGGGHDIIKDYQAGEVLRFEGPEFSADKLSVTQDGDNVKIMFGGKDTEVTVSDVDLSKSGYSVTRDDDAVVITFNDDK